MVCWGWFVYLWCIATSSWSSTSRCRYIFWWHMFFNNSLYIAFTWNINQFLLLNTFSFLFSQMFLLVNSTFLYFHPWTLNLLQSQPAITCSKLTIENFRTRCEIYSKLTRKTPERRQWLEWVQSWSHASWVTNDKAVLKKLLTVLPKTGLRRRERKIRMVIAKFFALYANPKRMAVQNSSYFKIAKESYYRFNFYIP